MCTHVGYGRWVAIVALEDASEEELQDLISPCPIHDVRIRQIGSYGRVLYVPCYLCIDIVALRQWWEEHCRSVLDTRMALRALHN